MEINQLFKNLHQLTQGLNSTADDAAAHKLLNVDYNSLDKANQQVVDCLRNILPKLRESELTVKALFPSMPARIRKDLTYTQDESTEKIVLTSGKECSVIYQYVDQPLKPTSGHIVKFVPNRTLMLKCLHCNQLFTNKHNFKIHTCTKPQPHTSTLDLPCSICKRTFDNLHNRNAHETRCRDLLRCGKCQKTYAKKDGDKMRTHVASCQKEPVEQLKCTFCFNIFIDTNTLQQHQLDCTAPRPCKLCNEVFDTKEQLHNHFNICQASVSCNICKMRCQSQHQLQQHKKTHHTQTLHTCTKCNTTYPLKKYLDAHLQTCSPTKSTQ